MKFEFKTTIDKDTEAKVLFDSEEEFDTAIESLRRLVGRYHLLVVKYDLVRLWKTTEGTRTLSNQIQDTTHRLALCLLDSYPDSKQTSIIAQEVGLTTGATSNNLTGKRGDAGGLFRRIEDGWTLSDEGLRIAVSEILPKYHEEPKHCIP